MNRLPLAQTAANALQREYYEEIRLKAQALVDINPNLRGDLTCIMHREMADVAYIPDFA